MLCSIYKITNVINNKVYIGQTWKPMFVRFNEHCYINSCVKLSNAIQKYGVENFKIELIAFASSQEIADILEVFFIEKYNSNSRSYGYNIRGGGSRGKISKDTKIKISIAKRGKKQSEEHKNNVSKALVGRTFSEEHKVNLSISAKKKIFSEDHIKKLSESGKIKVFSEEHRKKLSEAGKNNKNALKRK